MLNALLQKCSGWFKVQTCHVGFYCIFHCGFRCIFHVNVDNFKNWHVVMHIEMNLGQADKFISLYK